LNPDPAQAEKVTRETALRELTPREVVAELDRYIVGQNAAKRAVAIAVRNRWRRQQLPAELRREVAPKNILRIGPTGVGKTEIARRLARLTNAPFIKVEATKYTEVGYYGRDVESMVRELVENAIGIVRANERRNVEDLARERVVERLLDLLSHPAGEDDDDDEADDAEIAAEIEREFGTDSDLYEDEDVDDEDDTDAYVERFDERRAAETSDVDPAEKTPLPDWLREELISDQPVASPPVDREALRAKLLAGEFEKDYVELRVEQKPMPVMMGGMGMDHMDVDFQGMLEKLLPKQNLRRRVTVAEARHILFDQECDALLDPEKVNALAIDLAENLGIVFIDEIDKVVASDGKGADVSRQGVQRDLLPIVEWTTIQTRYGYVRTDHVLFVAAGAFHKNKPSDLMPELQGRFPIRVELNDLTKHDFMRILTEPQNSLTSQYSALLATEGITLEFTPDAVETLATFAFQVNQSTQNIGARRLYTILERLLEDLSFEAPDREKGKVVIDAAYVSERLKAVADDEDLSKFIL